MDFVETVAAILPLQTIPAVIGIPESSVPMLRYWTDESTKAGGPLEEDELDSATAHVGPMTAFFDGWIARKIGEEGNDLIRTLIKQKAAGTPLTYDAMHALLRAVLVAGSATTRDALAGFMYALAAHPDQLDRLVPHPELIPTAARSCCDG